MKIEDSRFPSVAMTLQALIAPVVAILLIFAGVILTVVLSGARYQDRAEVTRSQQIGASALRIVVRELSVLASKTSESAGLAMPSGAAPMSADFADHLRNGFGRAELLVVDPGDSIRVRTRGLEGANLSDIRPLIEQVRSGRFSLDSDASGFAKVGETVHAVAAAPLPTPVGAEADRDAAVLILAQPIGESLLSRLEADFLLRDLEFLETHEIGARSGLYVNGPNGETLGIFAWSPTAPGRELLTDIVAPIVIAALLSGLLLSSFLRTAVRATRAIRLGSEALVESDRALEQSESQLQAILDGAADAIITFDSEGIIVAANESAGRIFGYDLEQLVGSPADILLEVDPPAGDPGDRDGPVAALRAVLGSDATQYREFTGRRHDGSRISIDAAVSYVTYESGAVAIATMRDVTERRQAEETLNLLSTGMVLVSPDCGLLMANRSASRILDTANGLMVAHGRVVAVERSQTEQLRGLVSQVCNGATDDKAAVMTVSRGDDVRPLSIMVAPLQLARDQHSSEVAVIFIRDLEIRQTVAPEILGELFGLTPAEARVVVELVKGKRLQEVAEELGVSPNTVRNQLKQIFSKTNTGRQSELVSLVLSSAAFVSEQGAQIETAEEPVRMTGS